MQADDDESPIGRENSLCFSIYGGPEVSIEGRSSIVWADTTVDGVVEAFKVRHGAPIKS
jgi:hypothetical protein